MLRDLWMKIVVNLATVAVVAAVKWLASHAPLIKPFLQP